MTNSSSNGSCLDVLPSLNGEQLAALFPFFVFFDRGFRIIRFGPSLRKACPDIAAGKFLPELFSLERPRIPLTLESLVSAEGSLFLLKHVNSDFWLRAQLLVDETEGTLLFLGSPWIRRLGTLREKNLSLADFAVHDSTPELVQLSTSHELALDDLRRVAATLDIRRGELRQALDDLRAEEQQRRLLALIVSRSSDAIAVTDASGRTVWINESFVRLTGYSLDEIRGSEPERRLIGQQPDAGLMDQMRRKIGFGQPFNGELASYRKNGQRFWNRMEIQPILADDGTLSNWVYTISDVTAERQTAVRTELALQVSRILADSTDREHAVREILKTISEAGGCCYGALWWIDSTRELLRMSDLWAVPEFESSPFVAASRTLGFRPGEGLPGTVWLENCCRWIPDIENGQKWARSSVALLSGLRSGIAFPIRISGVTSGVLEIFSVGAEDLSALLEPLFETLGVQIGQFIERRMGECERDRLLSLLQSSMDSTQNGVVITDLDGSSILCNQSWRELVGSEASAAGAQWWRAFTNQFRDAEKQLELWKQLESPSEQPNSAILELACGLVIEVTKTPRRQAGRTVGHIWVFHDVSASTAQQREWERLASTLDSTLESTNDGILVTGLNRERITFNQRFLEIFGIPRYVVNSSKTKSLVPIARHKVRDPEYFEHRIAELYRDPGASASDVFELNNGKVIEVYSQPQRLSERIIGRVWSCRDITVQWRANRALSESEERYRTLTEAAPDSIITFDSNGVINFANRTAISLFGSQAKELTGVLVTALFPEAKRNTYSRLLRRLLRDSRMASGQALEVSLLDTSGRVFSAEVKLGTYKSGGGDHYTAIIRDISERKASEEQVRLTAKAADLANRAKSDFLANISHEIRTPLNAIVGLTELLRYLPLPQDVRENVDSIWVSAESLLALTNDLIDISKIEAGQIDVELQDFDVAEIAERALDVLRVRATAKSLPLYFFVEPSMPPLLRGDPNRIRQVLVNLLSNAIKFTSDGAVTISLKWQPTASGVSLCFSVTDTGVGISPSDQDRIFDAFYRVESPLTSQTGGAGLGLGICRAIASRLGGSLSVDSVVGKGSTFHFTLSSMLGASSIPKPEVEHHHVLVATVPARLPSVTAVVRSADFVPFQCADPASWPTDTTRFRVLLIDEEWADLFDFSPPSDNRIVWLRMTGRSADPRHSPILLSPLTPSRLHRAVRVLIEDLRKPKLIAEARLSEPLGRILLVEDNPAGQLYIKKFLNMHGHQVSIARTASEATNLLHSHAFNLVLLDLQLPDGSGLDVLRDLRTFETESGRAPTPVLVLSAHALSDFRESAEASGADDYITKPVRPGFLLQLVRSWLTQTVHSIILAQSAELLNATLPLIPEAEGITVSEDGEFRLPLASGPFDVIVVVARAPRRQLIAAALDATSRFPNAIRVLLGENWPEELVSLADSGPVNPIPNSKSALNRLIRRSLSHRVNADDSPISRDLSLKAYEITRWYLQGVQDSISSLHSSLAKGYFDEVVQFAHQLKGTGTSYGFPILSALAAQLETSAIAKDRWRAALHLKHLQKEILAAARLNEPTQ